MDIAMIAVSGVSLCLMIALYRLTRKFETEVFDRNRKTLEFIANLIPNAAYDPDIVRRLILDYPKEMRWRGGVFYRGDKQHSIAYEMPELSEITIGDLKIAVVHSPMKDDNTSS